VFATLVSVRLRSLIPTMFHRRNFIAMCEWQPLDGTFSFSVVQQLANGGDENTVMRAAYAKYFGRGPFMGDPIGTVLKHSSLTTVAQTDPGGECQYSVVTTTLALVVVQLDALGVAQISDTLKGLALHDIAVDVELGQRPHILRIIANNSS
jgi:hypothetical protein